MAPLQHRKLTRAHILCGVSILAGATVVFSQVEQRSANGRNGLLVEFEAILCCFGISVVGFGRNVFTTATCMHADKELTFGTQSIHDVCQAKIRNCKLKGGQVAFN